MNPAEATTWAAYVPLWYFYRYLKKFFNRMKRSLLVRILAVHFAWVVGLVTSMAQATLLQEQEAISEEKLKQHVFAIAHDSMQGRLTGTPEIFNAARYIAACMDSIGLQPLPGSASGFIIPWKYKMNQILDNHVAGMIRGQEKCDTMIIFSAHYDHIGVWSQQKATPFGQLSKRVKGDTIYNGANDNATGVAAMLELARWFMQMRPAYTLVFVAFSGEEFGLWGSYDYVTHQGPGIFERKKVKLNINLEMLGRPGKNRPFVTPPAPPPNILTELNRNLQRLSTSYPKNYFVRDPYPDQNLFRRSDNYSFFEKHVNAYTIMASSPRDQYYHSPADEAESIQYPAMRNIIQAIAFALTPIVLDR